MAKQRTSLTGALSGRLASKASREAPRGKGEGPEPKPRTKGLIVRLSPEAWRVLKLLSVEQETSLQAIMAEALNDHLRKNGKPPIV